MHNAYRNRTAVRISEYGLIAHGDADRTIPFEQGQRLFEAATGPKRFVAIPGGDHNDAMPEEYRVALDEFLTSLPR